MKKTQLILIVVGIIAVVGLYALPSVVVDNEGEVNAITEDNAGASTSESNPVAMHEAEFSPDQQATVASLRSKLSEGSSHEALDSLGSIYQELGKYDSAGYYFALAADESNDLALAEKAGESYYEAFTFALDADKVAYTAEQTQKYFNQVLEKDPTRLDLKTKVAMTYVSSSNPMQGITMLREILEQDPQNEDALFNMGILAIQSGQYKRAAERFEELIQYHPQNLQGQFYLGVSYFEANQKNKAKAQFEAVKEMTEDEMILSSIQGYLDRL
ncbi:cytochrome c-type biogenesis protein CcmH/NrfG [Algoriphagus iocasae]|uniref:Cytochrome c-type biogenesis protein CcmH/NrfG n=1 Tax=Algoriphagus iocasae TaxID=1836499 RepID=A0A841MVI6_9BACT|nr:tetratricopeptide repeat protein [Algoriphagus iocasae]MBB6326608.1 cytochrome c-type biogenesis protein CcmH/NrfG [Algoriphagus iocasae]